MIEKQTFADAMGSKRGHKMWVARAFDSTPVSYGADGDFHERFAQRLVEVSGLVSGQLVLDVATGTAPAAIAAATKVEPTGRVVGIDISAGILRRGFERLAQVGLDNVTLCRSDAEQLPFPDAVFDATLCSSSAIWFPDIPAAFRECRRVLKPGGLLAFSCFAQSSHIAGRLLRSHLPRFGIALSDLNEPLNTQEKCRAILQQAGFPSCEITVDQWGGYLHDPERIFQLVWDGNHSRFGFELTDAQLNQLKADYVADVNSKMTEHGFWNDMTAYFVRAVKL